MFTQAAAWEAAGDRRAIFLDCYARMTANMFQGIDSGRFSDAAWTSALVHHFAEFYFQALDAYARTPTVVPAPWSVAFTAATKGKTTALQHLFLGVNAHINHDLVLALGDLLRGEASALQDPTQRLRHADFSEVNQVIAETIDAVQDDVIERYTPALALLDVGLARLDEWIITRLISRWREEVWQQGVRMAQLPESAQREALRRQVERSAEVRAMAILSGKHLSSLL